MNVVDKIESKIGEFKEKKDYELTVSNREKKVFTVTNEELKEACWEILYQNVPSFHSSEENVPVISFKTEGGKNELIIQIGETSEEKAQREEQKKKTEETIKNHEKIRKRHEEIVKEHEKIIKSHEEIVRRHEEIQRESEQRLARIEESQKEYEKQFEKWKKEDGKCYMCGKKVGFAIVSFKNKNGKQVFTCSIECWKKGLNENENSNITQTTLNKNRAQPKQENQESQQITQPVSQSPNSYRNYLPWIAGGVSLIIAGIITYLLIRRKNK